MSGWSMYEPVQSAVEQAPIMQPNQFYAGGNTLPSNPHQAQAPPKQYAEETKNVPVPTPTKVEGSKMGDVSDWYNTSDLIFIGIAVLIVDIIVLFLIRFFPDFFGRSINVWYNRFRLEAVIADVFSIILGFSIARYVYTEYIYPNYDWNPMYFTGLTVVVQLIHDMLFYFGVIKTVQPGSNAMMDVFRDYAASGGAKVVAADSMMMVGSSVLSMLLKVTPGPWVAVIGLLSVYTLPYILSQRNDYSGVS
jgi:hypothetical protein